MNSPGRLIPEVEYYHGSRYKLENRLLSPDDVRELGNALATNSVRALSLQGVQLDDQSFRRISSSIGVCRSLCNLNLSDNVVTSAPRVEALCECLNINRGLTALFLQGNPLESQHVALISKAVKLHPTIRTLDLTNCSLNDTSLRCLTSLLPSEKGRDALEDLSIGSNPEVTSIGWQHFSMAVADNSCLRSLQLYFNNIGDHAACLLMVAISASKSIVNLDLENTNIGDRTAETLLQLITDFPNHLRDVNLAGNNISRDLLMKIKNRMSIHHAFQGGSQPAFNNNSGASTNSEGPSAPYYIPSHGVTNRPQTVPELDEEDSDEFETPRENADTARARDLLRNQLQQRREDSMEPTLQELDNNRSNSVLSSDSNVPEKPLSPPLTSRRIGTSIPGSRRSNPPVGPKSPQLQMADSGRKKSPKSLGATPDPEQEDVFAGIPDSLFRNNESPFSDVIISDGVAMLEKAQTMPKSPDIPGPNPVKNPENVPGTSSVTEGSRSNLGSAKITEITRDESPLEKSESKDSENFPSKVSVGEGKEEDGDPLLRSNSTTRTYTKSPAAAVDQEQSKISSSKPQSPTNSTSSKKPSSQGSQKKSPSLRAETIPRKDPLMPPDSSRLHVSKSLSFEKSLKNKNAKTGLQKSSTEVSIKRTAIPKTTESFQKESVTAQKEKSLTNDSLKSEASELSNAYPTMNFGVKTSDSNASSKEPSQENIEFNGNDSVVMATGSTNFGVNSKIKDPRLNQLKMGSRNNSASSTIASSYAGIPGGAENRGAAGGSGNFGVLPIQEVDLSDKNLGDVLRNSQVPVSNRMVDHGLNGELVKTQRDLSEESIPKSLKSLLSRNNTDERSASDINTTEEFDENPGNYLYASRAK